MGQTLTNGIYLPDEGERNSYSGLEANWRTLDALILTVNGKAAPNVANTWTAAQTFTAGIIGDLTGNVTGNVTGDLTGTASKAIADEDGTSIKTGYVNVAGNQTVTGNKDWTGINSFAGLTIKDSAALANGDYGKALTYRDNQGNRHAYIQPYKNTSGVVNLVIGVDNSGSVQLNSRLIPYAANAISLGSSSYQWSSVYAQSYYYNGTEFQSKFVTTDTDQTISGLKYFISSVLHKTPQTIDVSTNLAEDITGKGLEFVDNTRYWGDIAPQWTTDGTFRIRIAMTNYDTSGTGTGWFCPMVLDLAKDGSKIDIWSTHSNSNLGTSTNKWKTLNGVNPGALSLPDVGASYITVDTTNWYTNGASWNTIASANLIDGYLYINYSHCSADDYVAVRLGSSNYKSPTFCVSPNTTRLGNHFIYVTVPVSKQFNVYLEILTAGTLEMARIYPCLGNV